MLDLFVKSIAIGSSIILACGIVLFVDFVIASVKWRHVTKVQSARTEHWYWTERCRDAMVGWAQAHIVESGQR